MTEYHIFWLTSIFLGLMCATAVMGFGCWLLSKVVEDVSNSTLIRSYILRVFRLAPGTIVVIFGGFLIWRIVDQIIRLKLPI